MISPLLVVHTQAQPAAVIRMTIPREQIREVMGPAIMETIQAAAAQGIGPTGPVFSHHFDMQPGVFNFEVGVPVSSPVKPVGRVIASELPAAKVARTIYTGSYEGLGEAWSAFIDQLESSGYQTAPNLWERYLTDPATTPDESDYQTELNRPLL